MALVEWEKQPSQKLFITNFFTVLKEATFWKMLEKSLGYLMALFKYKTCIFVRP